MLQAIVNLLKRPCDSRASSIDPLRIAERLQRLDPLGSSSDSFCCQSIEARESHQSHHGGLARLATALPRQDDHFSGTPARQIHRGNSHQPEGLARLLAYADRPTAQLPRNVHGRTFLRHTRPSALHLRRRFVYRQRQVTPLQVDVRMSIDPGAQDRCVGLAKGHSRSAYTTTVNRAVLEP